MGRSLCGPATTVVVEASPLLSTVTSLAMSSVSPPPVPQLRSFCRHQVGWKIKRWLQALRLAEAERALADG